MTKHEGRKRKAQENGDESDGGKDQESSAGPQLLNTLPQHQAVWDSQADGDFNIHDPQNKLKVYTDPITGQKRPFCHLVSMNSFSRQMEDNVTYSQAAYESAIATMLAVQHLNTGNGSIISELEGLPERCPIQFSIGYVDTQYSVGKALNQAIALTHPNLNTSDILGAEDDITVGSASQLPPCAFLGATLSAVSGPTSIITGLEDFVQISGSSSSTDLDDRTRYPRFARTIPSDAGTTEALILFLWNELQLDYLAIINVNDSFGNAYATRMRDAARRHAPNMQLLQIPLDHDPNLELGEEEIEEALRVLRRSEVLYTFVILLDNRTHDKFMTVAVREGLAGNGKHNFMFTDGFDIGSLTSRIIPYNSSLHRAYSGTGIIRASGGSPGQSQFDSLMEQLQEIEQSDSDIAYAVSLLPGDKSLLTDNESFFHPLQFDTSSFNYDATILMGLAACDAVTQEMILSGEKMYKRLPQSAFQGVTGTVALDPTTGSRIANTTYYKIWNLVDSFLEPTGADITERQVRFESSVTHLFLDGQWTVQDPFIFGDGTTNLPLSLASPVVQTNHLHTATRAVVLLFCAIAIFSAIACAVWTWFNRSKRIVRASQPFFLGLICFGVAVFASSIIPVTFDVANLSLEGLGRACTSQVWSINGGASVIFSALFSKTHRINIIMKHARSFKRIKVTVCDTLIPMAVMFTINILILVAMTIFDPVEYKVYTLAKDRFGRDIETYGTCFFAGSNAYVIPLVVINLLLIAGALVEAWLARNLSTEFQESESIFRTILLIVLVIMIGAPVIFLARQTPDASVFIGSSMIFVISMGILLLLFIPKMRFEQRNMSALTSYQSGTHVHVSGLSSGNGGGSNTTTSIPFEVHAGNGNNSDDDTASCDGERILTTKTHRELAEEVAHLKRKLHAKERREAARGVSFQLDEEEILVPKELSAEMVAMIGKDMDLSESTTAVNNLSNGKVREVDTPPVNVEQIESKIETLLSQ